MAEVRQALNNGDSSIFDRVDSLNRIIQAGIGSGEGIQDALSQLAETTVLAEPSSPAELLRAIRAAEFLLEWEGPEHSGIRYLIREELLPGTLYNELRLRHTLQRDLRRPDQRSGGKTDGRRQ